MREWQKVLNVRLKEKKCIKHQTKVKNELQNRDLKEKQIYYILY